MKKPFLKFLIISEIFLPFIFSYLCQRLSIGRGYEFNIINPYVVILNFILWAAVFALFLGIFKKNYQAVFFYLLFFIIFSIANRYKIKVLNLPLKINDLTLGTQAIDFIAPIIEHTNLKKELMASFGFLFVSLLFLKHFFKSQIKKINIRLIFILFSLIIITLPTLRPQLFDKILAQTNITFHAWDAAENCRNNGVLLCFDYDQKYLKFPEPLNYNQTKINQIYSDLENRPVKGGVPIYRDGGFKSPEDLKPNIIIILSESLWDATQLSTIKYSQDPIKNIRSDIKSNFISPSFGGETANVEFELLTGLSNYFLPPSSYPYTQYIKKPIPSIFTLFKDQGYSTTAIHPYSPWFYNRQSIYKFLGVDKFTNLSNMTGYQNAGPFVSDKSFVQEILNQLNSTNQPQLIWAVSIQNHAPYEPNRFSNNQITFKSNLDSNDNLILQSYVNGINLSNESYSVLKKELTKTKKSTIVFLFGDHLPFLGDNFDIYKKTNFEITNEVKMHTTPLATWSNYKTNISLPQKISPSFLSLEILKAANITPKYQFSYLESISSTDTILNQKIPTKFTPDQLKNYELIQYDLIFGKQYFLKN